MYLSARSTSGDGTPTSAMIALVIILAVLFIFIAIFVYYKKKWPKSVLYVPKPISKAKQSRWHGFWRHGFKKTTPVSTAADERPASTNNADQELTSHEMSTNNFNNARGSIRSILTLPAYAPDPGASEQLIAREGERAGLDTVITLPETIDEEEARREQDMESLYQIRQARRREFETRTAHRRARAEASARGDWPRLEQLRLEESRRMRSRAASTESTGSRSVNPPTSAPVGPMDSATLIAEHTNMIGSRERRVSSVSYADLGLARHDGSRLRTDSMESDNWPLLDGAVGMGSNNAVRYPPSWNASATSFRPPRSRGVSEVSAGRLSDGGSSQGFTPRGSSDEAGNSGHDGYFNGSQEGTSSPYLPTEEPPGYEDAASHLSDQEAPPYTSPVVDRTDVIPRLPSLRLGGNLPNIEITESTPVTPGTPDDHR